MASLKAACVGEAMIELAVAFIPGGGQTCSADDVLNTAIYLRRGCVPTISFVTLLRTDRPSGDIVRFIKNEGISTDQIGRLDDLLPSTCAILTTAEG